METQEFGARLRQLRKEAGMTQRELAEKVNIDFTYLSKIENGVLPPPSEKVISQLADVLNTDKDELMILAGKIPSDIAQILKNKGALQRLRSHRILEPAESPSIKTGRPRIKSLKTLPKVAVAVVLTLAIIMSLIFATPAKALDLSLPGFPGNMYQNSLVSFYAQVDINTNEAIQVTSLQLDINGPTSASVVFNLDGSIISQSGHFYSITPVVVPYCGYVYGYASGYGYQPAAGYGYFDRDWGWGYGYGYGLGGYAAPTQAKYLIVLNTGNMLTGQYEARFALNITPAGTAFLSPTYSFAITALPAGGGGAALAAAISAVGSVNLTDYLDAEGRTTADITLTSADGQVTIFIPAGTRILDAAGNLIGSIGVIVLSTPPPPTGYSLVKPAYDCLPDGATFEPDITLTLEYNEAEIPDGVTENDLIMAYYDGTQWAFLTTTINAVANTASANVAHFTPFAVLAKLPAPPPAPAAFEIGKLSISPSEVEPGQKVEISAEIKNTGGTEGTYQATLKVNDVAEASKGIMIAAGTSKTLIFSVSRDEPGTYKVEIAGLSGEFVVAAPPEVAPPKEAPPKEAPPEVAPPGPNWPLIGGIIAAVVVIIGIVLWRRRRAM